MNNQAGQKQKVIFYEFMMFYQSGELLYFEDLVNEETIDIKARMEKDLDFKHRMYPTFPNFQENRLSGSATP